MQICEWSTVYFSKVALRKGVGRYFGIGSR